MANVTCKHCGHTRSPADEETAPAWACPACGRKYYEQESPRGLMYPSTWKSEWSRTTKEVKLTLIVSLIVAAGVLLYGVAPGQKAAVTNSRLDGSVSQVSAYLKQNLRDPESYRPDFWSKVSRDGENYQVTHRYRAKNGFGGYVLEEKTFILDASGNVLGVKQ